MGVMFYQNGAAIGTTAGWGGFTGNNNYVVRYDFMTGAEGASQVAVVLNNIFYGHSAGTQTFGFRISADPVQWCSARGFAPDSNNAALVYSSSAGYGCTLWAQGLNLLPNTVYYLFVYVTSSGAEYYTGWNCVNPQIVTGGSYERAASTISSVSQSVTTLGAVSVLMNRAGSNFHKATFSYGNELLAVSDAFTTSLSYTCPRSWLSKNTAAKSLTVNVSVQSYSDAGCTNPVGSPDTGSFTLTADKEMHPVFYREAVTISAVNANPNLSQFVSNISKARVVFDPSLIDISACAGAEISRYRISSGGNEKTSASPTLLSDVITSDGVIVCTVTDSRGCEYSLSVTVSVQPYVAPSLTALAAVRCGSSGTEAEEGAYYKVRFSAACSALTGNACSVSAAIKGSGGDYGAETSLPGFENGVWSDEWGSPAILGGTLSGDSFTVRFTVTDTVGGSSTYTLPLYRLHWAMKFNSNGTAVGFGMEPTGQECLQLPNHWRLYGGIPVLSPLAYGTAAPALAVSNPVEGQVYLRINT